ncbi:MAG TPA: twin-arginine translocation signal domain-containing protein [Bryobacterales bacterium]|nr:twin-arginine translocation signal domain-containing protein [Bryobacterales bacterium]
MHRKPATLPGSESGAGKVSRRNFIGGGAAAAAAAAIPLEPLLGGKEAAIEASVVPYNANKRMAASLNYRMGMARAERIDVGVQSDNGDMERFTDFSGNYSKALLHDGLGVPNKAAVESLIHAFQTGAFADFENILVGTPGGGPNSKENGPQGGLAFDLEGLDSHATVIPAAPSVASAQTAAEAVEHYWGALLRDVPFTEYPANSLVAQAVADMNNLSFLHSAGNRQYPFPVTAQNLFRGQFAPGDGNVQGPYISQFLLQPAFLGAQPLSQQYQTFFPAGGGGSDFMTAVSEYQLIQNGGDSGRTLALDPTFRFIRAGRDLAAYTHVDVLYQAYLIATLVLAAINAPPNPGNPYAGSKTEKGFGTLAVPDAVGTLTEMATRALKAAWFHKWMKDLRLRPEEYGALVQASLTKSVPAPQAAAALHPDVLHSAVLPMIYSAHGSYLLPQAFPEGSPTHPCYPTGHGTVGGACITAMKFFFDGSQKIRPLLTAAGRDVAMPSSDGLSLNSYLGADRDSLDINGELNKLAHNISFGHGIHAGIHFRSSTFWSILLGEQVALSVLRDRARSYNEPFTITITKFDGTTVTITNLGGNNQ